MKTDTVSTKNTQKNIKTISKPITAICLKNTQNPS